MKTNTTKEIPKEIEEIMSYLSHSFSVSMKSVINSKEDLYNDLVLLYLSTNKTKNKNWWFIKFKNYLIDKNKHHKIEKKFIPTNFEDINYKEDIKDDSQS